MIPLILLSSLVAVLLVAAAFVHFHTHKAITEHRESERKRMEYGRSKFATPAERAKYSRPGHIDLGIVAPNMRKMDAAAAAEIDAAEVSAPKYTLGLSGMGAYVLSRFVVPRQDQPVALLDGLTDRGVMILAAAVGLGFLLVVGK